MLVTFLIFLLLIFGVCIKIILWVHKQNIRRKEVRRQRMPLDQEE